MSWLALTSFGTSRHGGGDGGHDLWDLWVASVGGFVGALAVLLGVVLNEWLIRRRDRRRSLVQAFLDFVRAVRPLLQHLSGRGAVGEVPYNALAEVNLALLQVQAYAQRLRNAKAIREEANRVIVELATALRRRNRNAVLLEHAEAHRQFVTPLVRLVLPGEPIDEQVEDALRKEGLL